MNLTWRRPMRYFSSRDEQAFFRWLESIPGVIGVRGVGRELRIELRSPRVSAEALKELIALYRRYGGRLRDLAVFESPGNRRWFRNPKAYWYRGVFGSTK